MSDAAAAAAAEGGTPTPDGGTPAPDGGQQLANQGGTPAPDGGTPAPDGGSPPANPFEGLGEDWRQQLVSGAGYDGDDATKRMTQMERFIDPGAMVKSLFDAQDKIRKGEMSSGLPENATDEQVADWRKANDIPATAADYNLALDQGLVLGEDDQRIMELVYQVGHAENISNTAMSKLVNAQLAGRAIEMQAMLQKDTVQQQEAAAIMKTTWGGDFERNKNMMVNLVQTMPEATAQGFFDARTPDGVNIFNSPEFMTWFADIAYRLNPAGAVVPGSNNPVQAITDEIADIESRMGTDEYSKEDEKRVLELYTARENMAKR